jgi:hypothetical protein
MLIEILNEKNRKDVLANQLKEKHLWSWKDSV